MNEAEPRQHGLIHRMRELIGYDGSEGSNAALDDLKLLRMYFASGNLADTYHPQANSSSTLP
jgi:hypothetical protein